MDTGVGLHTEHFQLKTMTKRLVSIGYSFEQVYFQDSSFGSNIQVCCSLPFADAMQCSC